MKFRTILFLLVFPLSVFAQTELSKEEIWEDYTIFKNILTTAHPSMYEYTSQKEWDSLFSQFESKEIQEIKNADDLFRSMSALADHVKDGHLIIHHSKMDTIPLLLPLLLKVIDEKLYTDTDDFGIPVGSEIISIDGIESHEMLQAMLKYAPSDGYIMTKKYRQIEAEFGILHYYEYGASESYSVKYVTPDGKVNTTEISPQPFETIGKRSANRNSHFSPYHQNANRMDHFQNQIAERWPFVYYIDSVNATVLTVHSFGLDPKAFKSKLIELFKEIKKKKAQNLIIDIRQNIGGYRINAINLFSFLTNDPFKQRISESAITDVLPAREYILDTMSGYDQFFDMYFASAKMGNGRWVLEKDHAQGEMIPYKKPFAGNVYVLIGGKTFSAATAFALNAKNSPKITLVGEETGGGYYFHTGQYPVLYELPNSKIMVRISLVKIDKYAIDNTVSIGSGIPSDIEVALTVKDLVEGKDSQLDYIIQHIQEE